MASPDDSSSEEAAAAAIAAANVTATGSPFAKPAVPPRPRSILSTSSDHKKHNNLNNVMNAKNRMPTNGGGSNSSSNNVGEQYAMDLMPSKEADLSNEKCKRQSNWS